MIICTICHCCVYVIFFFFFFKQKTAYEMRISDWSSDVCSSDLPSPELGEEPKKSRPGGRRSKVSPGGALQVRRPRWSGHFLTKPIFCICAFLASASTLARTPYSACSLTSISSVGWLLTSRWTSVSIMLRSAESGVGLSFQKIVPDWSIQIGRAHV